MRIQTRAATPQAAQEAVDSYEAAAKALRYVFDNADDDTWLDQPVIDFVRNVVTLARRAAARPRQGERSGETLKRAGAEVLRVRVAAFRHSKVPPPTSHSPPFACHQSTPIGLATRLCSSAPSSAEATRRCTCCWR